MVRLIVTDFSSYEDNISFYSTDEFETVENIFTFDSLKKEEVFLPKESLKDDIYSLNLLSKKYLQNNEFLVYVSENEYYILYNHKTNYNAKINQEFFIDDLIKSILITKHITKLVNNNDETKIYFLIENSYKEVVESLFKVNLHIQNQDLHITNLGEVKNLVKPLNKLFTFKNYFIKVSYIFILLSGFFWYIFSGAQLLTDNFINKKSMKSLDRNLRLATISDKRINSILNKELRTYKNISQCMRRKVQND